jgi:hypothetical protein
MIEVGLVSYSSALELLLPTCLGVPGLRTIRAEARFQPGSRFKLDFCAALDAAMCNVI